MNFYKEGLLNMSLNLIIKNKTPDWRKNQPKLKDWTLKNGKSAIKHFNRGLSVEEQFSKEELAKIVNAIHATNAMGNPSVDKAEVAELDSLNRITR